MAPFPALAGPGNNGGDAFEAARAVTPVFLFDVDVVFLGNPLRLPLDAAEAYQRFFAAGGNFHTAIPEKQDAGR